MVMWVYRAADKLSIAAQIISIDWRALLTKIDKLIVDSEVQWPVKKQIVWMWASDKIIASKIENSPSQSRWSIEWGLSNLNKKTL